jgi:hypothetical protein
MVETPWIHLALATLTLVLGCSSSSGGGGDGGGSGSSSGGSGGSSYSCQIVTSGKNECDTSKGVPAGDLSGLEMQCTQNMSGKIVPSCPTTNVIACCTVVVSQGASVEGCFYQGETMPTTQAQCMQSGGTYSTTP